MAATEKALAEQLKGVPLFARTSAKQRKVLAGLGKVLTWKEGSMPIKEGTKGAAFFLILDGAVDVSRNGEKLARLSDGDFVGEMALLRNEPRNADVTAVSSTTVFAFGRPALAAALKSEPAMGLALLEAMANRERTIS
ncbi:MAG: cyclic nucleotide-binding domain-containing protein [Actinomycetota bacterium]